MWQAPERVPIPQLQHPAQLATPSRVQCRYSVVKEHKMRRITRPVAHKLAQRGHVQQAYPCVSCSVSRRRPCRRVMCSTSGFLTTPGLGVFPTRPRQPWVWSWLMATPYGCGP